MAHSPRTATLDGGVAVALAISLGLVFAADRFTPARVVPDQPPVVVTPHEEESARVTLRPRQPHLVSGRDQPNEEESAPVPLRLAVTPPNYDDMGKLLRELGEGYKFTDIHLEDLEDGAKLANFDVVFFTCGTGAPGWFTGEAMGAAGRPGVQTLRFDPAALERLRVALRAFVEKGGTLYASDWRLTYLRIIFPELAEGGVVESGAAQTLTADVVDPGLRERIGSTVELKFDLPDWMPARLNARGATEYLRGRYRTNATGETIESGQPANSSATTGHRPNSTGETVESPLLVRVPFGQGAIIFTSFHNEKVNSELETKLLQFLVFTAVTAKETQKSRSTMLTGGFVPRSESLLDASPSNPKVTQTYEHNKRGKLRFALSFNNQGARLKLSVKGPNGVALDKEGTSTFSIDVDNAETGRWSYTITALKLPHEHFPYSLTIGGE